MRSSGRRVSPTSLPGDTISFSASSGRPTECIISTARCAIMLVCSAGLAITVLPVTSAAATWPKKMASGKFHGLIQSTTPRGSKR